MSDAVIQSYVWHGEERFFVSTINRETSALAGSGYTYAETLVWEWPTDQQERGNIIWQGEGGHSSLDTHFMACRELSQYGTIREEAT